MNPLINKKISEAALNGIAAFNPTLKAAFKAICLALLNKVLDKLLVACTIVALRLNLYAIDPAPISLHTLVNIQPTYVVPSYICCKPILKSIF